MKRISNNNEVTNKDAHHLLLAFRQKKNHYLQLFGYFELMKYVSLYQQLRENSSERRGFACKQLK